MSTATRGIVRESPCVECGRDGYFDTRREPLEIIYDRDAVKDAPDWALTYERFGNGKLNRPFRRSFIPSGRLIVSRNVTNFFLTRRIKGVEFVPVGLSD